MTTNAVGSEYERDGGARGASRRRREDGTEVRPTTAADDAGRSPVETLALARRVGWWVSSIVFGIVLLTLVVGLFALTGVDPVLVVTVDVVAPDSAALTGVLFVTVVGTLAAVVVAILDS